MRIVAVICAALTFFSGEASAAIHVTTFADTVASGDGLCSLREALGAASNPMIAFPDCPGATIAGTTVVDLPPGTYHIAPGSGLSVLGATNIAIVATDGDPTKTVIAGTNDATHRSAVLYVAAPAQVSLSGVTITGGYAPDGSPGTPNPSGTGGAGTDGSSGGGLWNTGTMSLTHDIVSGNKAGSGGRGADGEIDLTLLIPYDGGAGGAGGAGGGIYNAGDLTIHDTTISNNAAGDGGDGGNGAMFINSALGGTAGRGGSGGGIFNAGMLTISDTTFSANHAGRGGTGGVISAVGGDGGRGGGLFTSGSTNLTNITLASNGSGSGGSGAAASADTPGANGGAAGGGGGIEYVNPGSVSLLAGTLTQNALGRPGPGGASSATTPGGQPGPSAVGGAIEDAGTSFIERSTVVATNAQPACAGALQDAGFNLVFPDSSCPGAHLDPLLRPLGQYGGRVPTAALQPSSPAIGVVPVGPACPSTDARGVGRPQPPGGLCDSGAFELAPPVCSQVASSTPVGTPVVVQLSCTNPIGVVTYAIDDLPQHGSLGALDTTHGKLTYTPSAGYVGGDSFTFHASNGDGLSAKKTVTLDMTAVTPVFTNLRIEPSRFRASKGATIRYSDNVPATTTFTILALRPGIMRHGRCTKPARKRHGKRCVRRVRVARFVHGDQAGANSVALPTRIRGRRLAPGRYRLQASPAFAGLTGQTATVAFKVLR